MKTLAEGLKRQHRPQPETFTEHRDEGFHAQAHAPQQILLQVDKGLGKHFLIVLWMSAILAAASIIAAFVLFDSFRVTRQHVKILEYDLMDLRTKTGNAHENTEE